MVTTFYVPATDCIYVYDHEVETTWFINQNGLFKTSHIPYDQLVWLCEQEQLHSNDA